jgi:molybdopterin molybdotransferase
MTSWDEGRLVAHRLGSARAEAARMVATASALGLTAAADVLSSSPLPPFDNSAMDGWAVAGEGPWREAEPILAGDSPLLKRLTLGEARPIATGAPVPPATVTVIRAEDATARSATGLTLIETASTPQVGRNIRRRGEEFDTGEVLVSQGMRVTPPMLGLLAAAGLSELSVRGPAPFAFLAVGDEFSNDGQERGRVNDSLSFAIPAMFEAMGGSCVSRGRTADRAQDVAAAISAASAPVIVTTGGTAHGPADPIRAALRLLGADVLIDGLDVRPGRSVLLSTTPEITILSLPGNPFAAIVDAVLLGGALLAGRLRAPVPPTRGYRLESPATGSVDRVIACREDGAGTLHPVTHQSPNMLRGVTSATHLVLTRPDGDGRALRLPWL